MTVHRAAPSRRRWWACPRCFEVIPALALVRWGEGLVVREGWCCAACLAGLRNRARVCDAPVDEWTWGVVVLDAKGDTPEGLAKCPSREPGPGGFQPPGGAIHPGDQFLVQRHLHRFHSPIVSLLQCG